MPQLLDTMSGSDDAASSRQIPATQYISLEHPGAIKDIRRGIETLSGDTGVAKFLRDQSSDRRLPMRVNPADHFRPPMLSRRANEAGDIVLRVTAPKMTGRKRKRGSQEPFMTDPQLLSSEADRLLLTLVHKPRAADVEPVGHVSERHRWRDLQDLLFSTSDNQLLGEMRSKLLPMQYSEIRTFELDLHNAGRRSGNLDVPPPSFVNIAQPFPYLYHQPSEAELDADEKGTPQWTGQPGRVQAPLPSRKLTAITFDQEPVPNKAPNWLPPLEKQPPHIRNLVKQVDELCSERPIFTRRALGNLLPGHSVDDIKAALPYRVFSFASGPWKDCMMPFGLDPRKDPAYTQYQALIFYITPHKITAKEDKFPSQWDKASEKPPESADSHLFDGESVSSDGKIWQLCDITDAQMLQVLSVPRRSTCDLKNCGWLEIATWIKCRVIMRHKLNLMAEGIKPVAAAYSRLVDLPYKFTGENANDYAIHDHTPLEHELSREIRQMSASYWRKDVGEQPDDGRPSEQNL